MHRVSKRPQLKNGLGNPRLPPPERDLHFKTKLSSMPKTKFYEADSQPPSQLEHFKVALNPFQNSPLLRRESHLSPRTTLPRQKMGATAPSSRDTRVQRENTMHLHTAPPLSVTATHHASPMSASRKALIGSPHRNITPPPRETF